jgi:hypothetical protein
MENGDPTQSAPPEAAAAPGPNGPAAAPSAPQPAEQPSLASLLNEFEESLKSPAPAAEPPKADPPQATPAPAAANPHAHIDAQMAEFNQWQKTNALELQVKGLSSEVEAARTYIDHQHFDAAVGLIEKRLSDDGLCVPASFVRDSLIAMSVQDEALRSAFDNRGANPGHFNRLFKKAQHRIYEAARSMPDPEATANRAAVAAAIRGTTAKTYAEPTPKYGSMTEAEFTKEKAKFGL